VGTTLYPSGLVDFQEKSNMAARPCRMNVDEVLAEIFTDRDSHLCYESDQESEDVSEYSGKSSESDDEEEGQSVEEDDPLDASDSESE